MIITDEKILRMPCQDVLPEEVGELRELLVKELNYANKLGKNGIGLAAPQIGIHKKMAIIRLSNDLDVDLVNCIIENSYDPIVFKDEGCLSIPNKTADTIRFQEIHIANNLVYPHSFIATGFLAVAIQHELDHLNSILFTDRLSPKEPVKTHKIKPNDLCYCGSKVKYKRCHGK